jgi:hypothetical protein
MNTLRFILFATLIAYTISTSCYCNTSAESIGMQCEGLDGGGSACRCSLTPGYPFTVTTIQNVGCAVTINNDGIFLTGTNCPGGTTNQCAFLIKKKSSSFLTPLFSDLPNEPKFLNQTMKGNVFDPEACRAQCYKWCADYPLSCHDTLTSCLRACDN